MFQFNVKCEYIQKKILSISNPQYQLRQRNIKFLQNKYEVCSKTLKLMYNFKLFTFKCLLLNFSIIENSIYCCYSCCCSCLCYSCHFICHGNFILLYLSCYFWFYPYNFCLLFKMRQHFFNRFFSH